ncbi:SIR2 family protein [Nonomuraea sp. SMC257]|uniref:SIR2 family protein n=1 Tax=Nonomuraea montanisoli TaxID=2741721 RepID=A0A7Y6M1I3_9ACTN|nr:SIR2 family protein [Nonomuraea montanisoli]NUW31668.1 SIR2 family protein [Nonomuraea montanisoli]
MAEIEWRDGEWDRLVDQLIKGDCVPFVGAGASAGVLPDARSLSRRLAEKYKYPYDRPDDLTEVTDYLVWWFGGDVPYVKSLICEEFRAGAEGMGAGLEPYALLAELPLPIFITTNYDDFLLKALARAHKKPNIAICPWHDQIDHSQELLSSEAGWNPRPDSPLIYHLHGSMRQPQSIVLTNDDYEEFITSLVADRDIIPPVIRAALTTRSLLFIGYGMRDMTFRTIFNGLQRVLPGMVRRRHVSVQLPPLGHRPEGGSGPSMMQYQAARFDKWRISIYWGTIDEFTGELRRRLGRHDDTPQQS